MSEQYDIFMQLDLHSEAYSIQTGEKFRMVLAPTLHLDGSEVTDYFIQVISFLLCYRYLDLLPLKALHKKSSLPSSIILLMKDIWKISEFFFGKNRFFYTQKNICISVIKKSNLRGQYML